jgi:hypothetical protein
MAAFACTVDVITWLDATFVSVDKKPIVLSSLKLLLLLMMGAD